MAELSVDEDRFGFDYHTVETVCTTSRNGEEVVTISVKNLHTGVWEDRNFTRQQIQYLKQILNAVF